MEDFELKEVWQAFSALSDAQDTLIYEDWSTTDTQIDHAKAHLMALIERADQQHLAQVMLQNPSCTLSEGMSDFVESKGHDRNLISRVPTVADIMPFLKT